MATAFSATMPSADVDSFLSQMEQPPTESIQGTNNSGRSVPGNRSLPRRRYSRRPVTAPIALPPLLSQAEDDSFNPRNNNATNDASPGFLDDHDDSDDDDAPFMFPSLVSARPPTEQEILAKHTRLTTVYDPLHPPPDDEQTREGTALGLRPDHEGRLFLHQTMRLGRWCGMTGQHVDRDELTAFEKDMLDWKFERPAAPRRRVPPKEAVGRGCLGAYLRRRNRIPRYEVTRRRLAGSWPQGATTTAATTHSKRAQAGSSAAGAAARSAPAPMPSLFQQGRGGAGAGATAASSSHGMSSKASAVNPNALAEAFYEWRAKKARGEPTGTPQEWLAAFAQRNSTGNVASATGNHHHEHPFSLSLSPSLPTLGSLKEYSAVAREEP